MNVLLDLDQTLISAEADEDFDFTKFKEKATLFDLHDMDSYYLVFERPNLQEFLDFLFANFNVSVWTAASKDYALFIIDKIILTKPERKLDFIFFNYHCSLSSKQTGNTKDLSMLWDIYQATGYNSSNTIILDDYDEVKETQPCNCIAVPPFEFTEDGSENDNFLLELIPKLENMKNVMETNQGNDMCIVDFVN